MGTGQQKLIQLDSSDIAGADVGLLEAPEKKKKKLSFYEPDVLRAPKVNKATEDTKSTKSADEENEDDFSGKDTDLGYLDKAEEKTTQHNEAPGCLDQAEEKTTQHNEAPGCLDQAEEKTTQNNEAPGCLDQAEEKATRHNEAPGCLDQAEEKTPHDDEEQSLNYFDQTSSHSPPQSHRHRILSCPCKECVENLQNRCEEVQNPTIIDKQKNDEFLTCEDSVSLNSNRSRSASEKSRHTNSSEEELTGNRLEDTQVTLPYPDNSRPPECITRLSNGGLYEPNEDLAVKANKDEEDKISQVVSTAFFVQHPDEKMAQQKRVQLEMEEKVDIEKGEAECEPLIRTIRRTAEEEPPDPRICHCNRGCLKIVGSFVASMIVFPAFLYGAYAWLPFNTPLMPDIPTRLVYTLRCASFATFPIILGVIIHGISRLCAASYDPFKPREHEVTIHRRFVKQGTFLFVLYFFNLSVLATYLSQDHLKVIPLLTCLFTLAQLIYWLSFAVSRSFRGFGYGLTFLPLLAMMSSNLYFMFLVEPEKMVFLGSRYVPQN